jgi:hypothetical protein
LSEILEGVMGRAVSRSMAKRAARKGGECSGEHPNEYLNARRDEGGWRYEIAIPHHFDPMVVTGVTV